MNTRQKIMGLRVVSGGNLYRAYPKLGRLGRRYVYKKAYHNMTSGPTSEGRSLRFGVRRYAANGT